MAATGLTPHPMPPRTHYDTLRVGPRTKPERVRLAYRRLAQQHHPDRHPDRADAQQVMAAINEAYAVLSDPDRRARYDEALHAARMSRREAFDRRLAEVQAQDRAWPWWLLAATLAFSATAIAVSVYKGYVPASAVSTRPR